LGWTRSEKIGIIPVELIQITIRQTTKIKTLSNSYNKSKKTINQKIKKIMEPTFEESLRNLESIIKKLDDDNTSLDEALTSYEDAVKILKRCYNMLTTAERKIEILRKKDGKNEIISANENEYKSNPLKENID
jgi:exodeoxyribonuclease VII small subunit